MDPSLSTPPPSLFFPGPHTQSRVPCVLQGPGRARGSGQDHGVASAARSPGAEAACFPCLGASSPRGFLRAHCHMEGPGEERPWGICFASMTSGPPSSSWTQDKGLESKLGGQLRGMGAGSCG